MRPGSLLPVVLAALGLIALQVTVTATGREYYLTQMIMTAYYAVVALGLCLVMGYAGQISLGHAAFFALGGYTSAVLTTADLTPLAHGAWGDILLRLGLLQGRPGLYGGEMIAANPWAAFAVALLLAFIVALLVGYPALRLKGHYLAMATLGFGLIVYRLVLGTNLTGAADGITGVPPWPLGLGLQISGDSTHRLANYYVAWGLVLLVILLLTNVMHSRAGRAFRAIHGGETAANSMGINTAAYKLRAFVLSALLAAAAGSMLTHYNGGIGPSEAGAMKSVRYVALVAAGGMANLWGVLVVSATLNFLSLRGCFGSYDDALFGALLIAIVSLTPEGPLRPLAVQARRLWNRLAHRRLTDIGGIAQ